MNKKSFFNKYSKRYLFTFFLLFFSFFLIIFLLIYYLKTIFDLESKINFLQNEIRELSSTKNRVDLITKNKNIEIIDNMIDFLNKMVPLEDNFFTLINSVQNITNSNYFELNKLTLDKNLLKNTKIPLEVSLVINESDLNDLFNKYKFSYGRLITIESIDFKPLEKNNNVILFLHNTPNLPEVTNKLSAFSELNIKNIEKILQQENNNINTKKNVGEENLNENYLINPDPFSF